MSFTTSTLTGKYLTTDGDPAQGVIEIIPNSRALIDPEGNVILSGRVKVKLGHAAAEGEEGADADGWVHDGSFSVTLPSTDDATVEPATGRQYAVSAKLKHTHLAAVAGIELAGGETVDMADVAPAAEAAATFSVWLTAEEYAADLAAKAEAADITALDTRLDTAEALTNSGRLSSTSLSATHATVPAALRPRPRFTVPQTDPTLTFLTKFAAGHGWTGSGTNGSANVNDTSVEAAYGFQCATITAGTAGSGNYRIDKGGLAIDLSGGSSLLVKMKVVSGAFSSMNVYAFTGGVGVANNYFWFTNPGPDGGINEGEWNWYEFKIPRATVNGAPNPAALDAVRISNENGGSVIAIGAVAVKTAHAGLPNGGIVWCFDDGMAAQFSEGKKYLDKYGLPGVCLPVVDVVGSSASWVSLENLKQMRHESGWEIAGHAATQAAHNASATGRFVGLTTTQLHDEFRVNRRWLVENGLGDSPLWASPGGKCNGAVWNVARQYFAFHRFADAGATQIGARHAAPFVTPDRLRSWTWATTDTEAGVKAAMDAAKARKAVFLFTMHDLLASGGDSGTITPATFRNLVDYAQSIGLPSMTFSQALTAVGYPLP